MNVVTHSPPRSSYSLSVRQRGRQELRSKEPREPFRGSHPHCTIFWGKMMALVFHVHSPACPAPDGRPRKAPHAQARGGHPGPPAAHQRAHLPPTRAPTVHASKRGRPPFCAERPRCPPCLIPPFRGEIARQSQLPAASPCCAHAPLRAASSPCLPLLPIPAEAVSRPPFAAWQDDRRAIGSGSSPRSDALKSAI